jgi:predicted DCC family thiol-disulfide oxidoreductase YuxK
MKTEPTRLFYDGDCGFCHRSVRFVLDHERPAVDRPPLRFAPLGGPTFLACLARNPALDPAKLPDSLVLALEDGRILTRSAAVLELGSRLGGPWRLLATLARAIPTALLDAAYDAVARIRKRLFAAPKDTCPILPPAQRVRFDA